MRLQVSFPVSLAAAAMAVCISASAAAQSQTGQSTSSAGSSPDQEPANGTYIAIDPLANVKYDNRYDVSLGMAYDHMKAGPNLLQGSNLGGLDLSGSYWLTRRWGVQTSERGYVGTSGAAPNSPNNVKGPFVSEWFFTGGPEWLGPHNKHGAILAHALVGGVYGRFEQDLLGQSPAKFGFYNNQFAPAGIVGGSFDLNRSARWVFRITPDAVMTWYSTNYGQPIRQWDVNFAISVGLEYKFKKKR